MMDEMRKKSKNTAIITITAISQPLFGIIVIFGIGMMVRRILELFTIFWNKFRS